MNKIYPTKLELKCPLKTLSNNNDHIIIQSDSAITLKIIIDSNLYQKKDISDSVKGVCQKLIEYYD